MKKCAFCENPANSGEHLWSDWICELIPHKGFTLRRLDTSTGKYHPWHSSTLDQKTKVVCRECNSTWMSDIESEARQTLSNVIVDGAPLTLLPRGIAALTAYAFKCVVISNHMNLHSQEPYFLPYIRHRFRDYLEIPRGTQMWLSAFRGKHASNGVYAGYFARPQDRDDFEFYVFTFMAGFLVFQVACPRANKLHLVGRRLPRLAPTQKWSEATTQFWPNDHGLPILWPPRLYLSDDTINVFRDRFSGTVNVIL